MSPSARHVEIALDQVDFDEFHTLRFSNPSDGYGERPGEEKVLFADIPPGANTGRHKWVGGESYVSGPPADPSVVYQLLCESGLVDEEMINQQVIAESDIEDPTGRHGEWTDDVPEEIRVLWDEYEMANDFERFVAHEARHELLSAIPEKGNYMVPTPGTLLPGAKEWASIWDGGPVVFGEYPFTTTNSRLSGSYPRERPEQQNLNNVEFNILDQQNRVIVSAEMTQFGTNYHTAMCEFGRIHVPLKFNRYLNEIDEPMKMLVRLKQADKKHPFACIRVL